MKTKRRPKAKSRLLTYVDNVELRRPARVEAMLAEAETLLASDEPTKPVDETSLFKAMNACARILDRGPSSRFKKRRSRRTLLALRQRIQDALVNQNIGLIYEMRRRTRVTGVDPDDLFSEGLWTLFRSIASFDPWRGFRFSTYACTSILRAFLLIAKRRRREVEQRYQLSDRFSSLTDSVAREPDLERQRLMDRLSRTLDDNSAGLTPAERFVIERRLLNPAASRPETLESIGETFNLSKERVRQIQLGALNKLRTALESMETLEPSETGKADGDWLAVPSSGEGPMTTCLNSVGARQSLQIEAA